MVDLSSIGTDGSNLEPFLRRLRSQLAMSWWVIAVPLAVGAVVGLCVSLVTAPVYRSSVTLYVTSATADSGQNAYQGSLASEQRVLSYSKLVDSDAVLQRAVDSGRLGMTVPELRAATSSAGVPDTSLLTVFVEAPSPEGAAVAANAVAGALVRYVDEIERPDPSRPALAKATVVTPAGPEREPVSPIVWRNILIGLLLGMLIGICVFAIRFRLDTVVRTATDLARVAQAPLLSEIPIDAADGLVTRADGGGVFAESFRRLRTGLNFVDVDNPIRCVQIASANPGEGKTTLSLNFAAVLADAGASVVLLEADLRRPSIAKRTGMSGTIGLTSVLKGELSLDDAVQRWPGGGFDVVLSGPLPPNPSELLGSARAGEVLRALRHRYDYVVVDCPPLLPVTDALVMAGWTDGMVLAVRSGVSKGPDVVTAEESVMAVNGRVVGTVLNAVPEAISGHGYSAYAYSDDVR